MPYFEAIFARTIKPKIVKIKRRESFIVVSTITQMIHVDCDDPSLAEEQAYKKAQAHPVVKQGWRHTVQLTSRADVRTHALREDHFQEFDWEQVKPEI